MPEVDSFYLPDTAGVSYRNEHAKTTIGIVSIDLERHVLRYFHGRGLHTLGGNDFAGLFRLGEFAGDYERAAAVCRDREARRRSPAARRRRWSTARCALTRFHLAAAPRVESDRSTGRAACG